MQREDGGFFAVDSFTTDSGPGALERKRFSLINGLAAVGFLLFGAVELLTLVAGHSPFLGRHAASRRDRRAFL